MKSGLLVVLPALSSAFVAPVTQTLTSVLSGAKEDLMEYAKSNPDKLGSALGFWDPLNVAESDFWGLGNEATIGYLRHSEIKHGRVAMAAFLGFLAQSTPLVSGEHVFAPYKGYVAGVTPQEQWDNIPYIAKLQIITFIGMLESYGEGAGSPEGYVHYCNGGKPGYYPPIKGKGPNGEIQFNLFDPLGWFPAKSEEKLEFGRKSEINNGRLAMIGIFGLLSESQTPGSVPALAGIASFPKYAGECMAPFSADFSFSTIPAYTAFH